MKEDYKSIHVDDVIVSNDKDLIITHMDDEIVMMSIDKGKYYGLGHMGSRIWEFIQTPKTVKELLELLMQQFDGDGQIIEQDVLSFLDRLAREGIVKVNV